MGAAVVCSPTVPHLTPLLPTTQPLCPTRYAQRHHLRVDARPGKRTGAAARREVERVEPVETGARARTRGLPRSSPRHRTRRLDRAGAGPPCTDRRAAPSRRARPTSSRRGAARDRADPAGSARRRPCHSRRARRARPTPCRSVASSRAVATSTRARRAMQQRVGVARAEVDGVAARELVPGKRLVVAARMELAADRDDRPLATVVDEREAAPLRRVDGARVNGDTARPRARRGERARVVVAEHGEEVDGVRELRELHGGDRASAGGLLPRLVCVDDVPALRDGLDRARTPSTRRGRRRPPSSRHSHRSGAEERLTRMMQAVAIPPFERFYDEHRSEVLRLLRRRLGAIGPRMRSRRRSCARFVHTDVSSTASTCERGC